MKCMICGQTDEPVGDCMHLDQPHCKVCCKQDGHESLGGISRWKPTNP